MENEYCSGILHCLVGSSVCYYCSSSPICRVLFRADVLSMQGCQKYEELQLELMSRF